MFMRILKSSHVIWGTRKPFTLAEPLHDQSVHVTTTVFQMWPAVSEAAVSEDQGRDVSAEAGKHGLTNSHRAALEGMGTYW